VLPMIPISKMPEPTAEIEWPTDRAESPQLLRATYSDFDVLIDAPATAKVGVALIDRHLRYSSINHSMAQMNGLPVEAHIGKTMSAVLGSFADLLVPRFESVFTTGEPIVGFEVTGKLSTRPEIGYWVEDLFPIGNPKGKVTEVCVLVTEVTSEKTLQRSMNVLRSAMFRNLELQRQETTELMLKMAKDGRFVPDCAKHILALRQAIDECRVLLTANTNEIQNTGRDKPNAKLISASGRLSMRELEIVRLLAEGRSNKQIANTLGISIKTVETHRSRTMLKLRLDSLAALVRFAVRSRLVQP